MAKVTSRIRQRGRMISVQIILLSCILQTIAESTIPQYYPTTLNLEALVEEEEEESLASNSLEEGKIVGGTQSEFGAYPFFVRLDDQFGNSRCAGSLVASDVVLTAAHCFNPNLSAVVGSYTSSIFVSNDDIPRNIALMVPHEMFRESTFEYDFMLLKLDRPVNTVEPVGINFDEDYPEDGADLKVIGLGATNEAGGFPVFLQEVVVQKVAHEVCAANYAVDNVALIREDVMLCAAVDGGGRDACQGDAGTTNGTSYYSLSLRKRHSNYLFSFALTSGGPLLGENGLQVGIVSFGLGCGRAAYPGVYSKVSAVQDWLETKVCDELAAVKPGWCSSEIEEREPGGPTGIPSFAPSLMPSTTTSESPTIEPSTVPSLVPSGFPSLVPSSEPTTSQPSRVPSVTPSSFPSLSPTVAPSAQPSIQPSIAPSRKPSQSPTGMPSLMPSIGPTPLPTPRPVSIFVINFTPAPSQSPTGTRAPIVPSTAFPSSEQSNLDDTALPANEVSSLPSDFPSRASVSSSPSDPSTIPTGSSKPSFSAFPSQEPSGAPQEAKVNQALASPPSACDDNLDAKFSISRGRAERDCGWLQGQPSDVQLDLCSLLPNVRDICEETCGKCSDECRDDLVVEFPIYIDESMAPEMHGCAWLKEHPKMRDQFCTPDHSAYGYCLETCNSCEEESPMEEPRNRQKVEEYLSEKMSQFQGQVRGSVRDDNVFGNRSRQRNGSRTR